jgi:hypothetical protein
VEELWRARRRVVWKAVRRDMVGIVGDCVAAAVDVDNGANDRCN